jgi:competence protein ComFB
MTQNNQDNHEENRASIKLTPHQERVREALLNRKHNVFNVVEILANEKVADMMDRMEMCTCSKCTCDVLAIALNSLPTKYVTSDAGKQYIQLNSFKRQFETDVEIALMRACQTVKESPNHDGEQKSE